MLPLICAGWSSTSGPSQRRAGVSSTAAGQLKRGEILSPKKTSCKGGSRRWCPGKSCWRPTSTTPTTTSPFRRNGRLYTESDLAAFFTEHLNPDLFKSNYRPRANNRQAQFWFAPYEDIRGHFLTKYLGEDFFDTPGACPSAPNEPAAMEDY